jgi:hypothetical protein
VYLWAHCNRQQRLGLYEKINIDTTKNLGALYFVDLVNKDNGEPINILHMLRAQNRGAHNRQGTK